MSTSQTVYVGPYLHFAAPGRGDELGEDQSLMFAFAMGAKTGNVWIPNDQFAASHVIDSSTGDSAEPLSDLTIDHARRTFRERFSKQRSILKKAFGSGGTVRYGVVVWWG